MKNVLYKLKRSRLQAKEYRRLEQFLKANDQFLKRYLESARLTLEEVYKTEQDPLISVIIPTYNLGKILVDRTIPSVLSQTYANWELIVYGDVCTDETEKLMQTITDKRVKFYNLRDKLRLYADEATNRMHSNGWKPYMCALHDAAGRWIALLNDDDEFTPDHLEVLLRHAQKNDAEFVYANQFSIQADGTQVAVGREGFPRGEQPFFQCCVPQRTVLMRSYLKPFLFNRMDFLPKIEFAGDMVWWEQMGLAGVRASYLDKVVAIKHRGVQRAPAVPQPEKTPAIG